MSGIVVALMFAAGVTAWVYSKIDRKTAGNSQPTIVVSVVVFVICFLVAWSITDLISS